MPKKINHYKLESIRKECDVFVSEKEELLNWYKEQSKILNKIETTNELKNIMFKLKDEIIVICNLKQMILDKLTQDDYNISKGVVEILNSYDGKIKTLSSCYNEQIQKIDLLVKDLVFEYQLSKIEINLPEEEEEELPGFFESIGLFLVNNFTVVFAIVAAILFILVVKYIAVPYVEKLFQNMAESLGIMTSGENIL